jgi:hypothetical protein
MKIKFTIASVFLITLASSAFATKTTTVARLDLVSKEMKSVDACENHYIPRDFNPTTFGKGNQKFSILAYASKGNVMVGNETTAFQLMIDKGTIQSINNGKVERTTYSIDPKAFMKQLTSLNQFLIQALSVAQKDGKSKDVQHVSCAVAIVQSAKKHHNA